MEAATLPLLGRENRVQHPTMEFDDFYRREFTGLVVLAAAVTGERQGAEDIVQESMLDAHRRWDRIGSYDSPRGWVRRVVIQRALKWSRRRLNEGRSPQQLPSRRQSPRGSSTSTTIADECSLGRGARIYLQPTATDEQIATIRAALVASGAHGLDYVDRAATYREFRDIFHDQPDLLAASRPEDLPTSFRVSDPDAAGRIDWPAMRSLPGVLRVEPLARGCASMPAGTEDVPSAAAITTPADCPTRPGLADLGKLLPTRFDPVPLPGAGGGSGIGGPCTRHWEVPGDPGTHVTEFVGDSGVTVSSLGGTVVEAASLDGWSWGHVEDGLWLADPSGRFVVVGYGVDEAEWRALIGELIKQP